MSSLTVLDGCATIQFRKGGNTLIDAEDLPRVSGVFWHPYTSRNTRYVIRSKSKSCPKGESLHRVIMGNPEGLHIDHRNGDGLDNRKANLRTCTLAENHRNRHHPWGSSKYKGVFSCPTRWRRPWKASIKLPGDKYQICLGRFPTEQDAARAYDNAAAKHFGEFAATNAQIFGDL